MINEPVVAVLTPDERRYHQTNAADKIMADHKSLVMHFMSKNH